MDTVSQNGILKEEAFSQFKERTVKLRFMQQISYGTGAAMVFGLISAVAGGLLNPIVHGGLAALTIGSGLGLFGIAAFGVGLIYFSAKFLSENTLLEQDFQAKKIGMAARGVAPEQEQVVPVKPMQFPEQNALPAAFDTAPDGSTPVEQALANKPTLLVNNMTHAGRAVAANDLQPEKARA